eukprot:sb/3463025/
MKPTVFTETFTTSELDTNKPTTGGTFIYQSFAWRVAVKQTQDQLSAFLHCEPLDSVPEWSCTAGFSLTERDSGLHQYVVHTFSSAVVEDETTLKLGKGWTEFMPISEIGEREEFVILAEISVKDSFFGEPSIRPYLSLPIVFSRDFPGHLLLRGATLHSSHKTEHVIWDLEVQCLEKEGELGVTVTGYNAASGLIMELNDVVVSTVRQGTEVRVMSSPVTHTAIYPDYKVEGEDAVVKITIDIHTVEDKPSLSQGVNFGRGLLALPQHGNYSFILKDGSRIEVTSFILAHNSPVLKKIIEGEGELDHDVSDFQPEAVRIFVDACYTGSLEKLVDDTEFKVFGDLVKLLGVFQVSWTDVGCLSFYETNLPDPTDGFTAYWDYALLALDLAVKHGSRAFLTVLLSNTPAEKSNLQLHFSTLLANTTKPQHLDLLMAMVVQFDLVSEFMQQILALLMVGYKIPLFRYWLANFNFKQLCEGHVMKSLMVALERITDAQLACSFLESLEEEEEGEGIKLVTEDGTLVTLARNHWCKIRDSVWPCMGDNKQRPFSNFPRNLEWEEEEVESEVENEVEDEVEHEIKQEVDSEEENEEEKLEVSEEKDEVIEKGGLPDFPEKVLLYPLLQGV